MRGMGDIGMMGDVPTDYNGPTPPFSGRLFAPYDPRGPLGAVRGRSFRGLRGLGLTGKALARAQFLTWLKDFNPTLFQAAVQKAEDWKAGLPSPTALSGISMTDWEPSMRYMRPPPGMGAMDPMRLAGPGVGGLGDDTTAPAASSWWDQLSTAATSLGTAYLAYKGQQNVLATNIQRANMGLPPIDPTTGAPTVRTTVALSPQLMARLQDTGSLVLYAGLAVGALLLLKSLLKK